MKTFNGNQNKLIAEHLTKSIDFLCEMSSDTNIVEMKEVCLFLDSCHRQLSSNNIQLYKHFNTTIEALFEELHVAKVVKLRAEKILNCKIDSLTAIYIALNAETVGEGVILLYYYYAKFRMGEIKSISYDEIVKVYKHKVPAKENLKRFWEMQKIKIEGMVNDNGVDFYRFFVFLLNENAYLHAAKK